MSMHLCVITIGRLVIWTQWSQVQLSRSSTALCRTVQLDKVVSGAVLCVPFRCRHSPPTRYAFSVQCLEISCSACSMSCLCPALCNKFGYSFLSPLPCYGSLVSPNFNRIRNLDSVFFIATAVIYLLSGSVSEHFCDFVGRYCCTQITVVVNCVLILIICIGRSRRYVILIDLKNYNDCCLIRKKVSSICLHSQCLVQVGVSLIQS